MAPPKIHAALIVLRRLSFSAQVEADRAAKDLFEATIDEAAAAATLRVKRTSDVSYELDRVIGWLTEDSEFDDLQRAQRSRDRKARRALLREFTVDHGLNPSQIHVALKLMDELTTADAAKAARLLLPEEDM